MTDIKWEDPPAQPPSLADLWGPVFVALRERPGEWALVAERNSPTLTTQIKMGNIKGCSFGEFETRSHKNSSGKYNIYVRYVGSES